MGQPQPSPRGIAFEFFCAAMNVGSASADAAPTSRPLKRTLLEALMRSIAILIAFLPSFVLAADLSLTRDGKSAYAIVTAAQPSASETLAAEELANYIKQIAGANL